MSESNTTPSITDEERATLDGEELLDDLGFDEEEIDLRKRLAQFDETDAERLSELAPIIEEIEEETVDDFYAHLQSHRETRDIFEESSRSIADLKDLQSQYLQGLGQGKYERSYFERRARIGKVHDMIGLEPRIFLGAYSVYYEQLLDGITSQAASNVLDEHEFDGDVPEQFESALSEALSEVQQQTLSTLKLLLLDQQIAIDTYIHSYSQIEEELQRQQEVATEVRRSVNQLEAGANVVGRSAQQMGDITDEQVASMQEVATEMSDLSATVEEIAASAEQVNTTSEEAETLSETATETAQEAIDRMEQVETAASGVSADIQTLRDSVEEIDELAEVINEIADQTNILALNASIEAARAGEDGDGFAVVAEEVKSLATESKQQAEHIRETVDQVQENTVDTAESIDVANQRVSQAMEEVTRTVERLEKIADAIEETSSGIEQVAEATDEQAASTEEVATMIDQSVSDIKDIAGKIDEVVTVVDEQTERTEAIEESISRLIEAQ